MNSICPECKGKLYGKVDKESGFIENICWQCGYYESDSPAYKLMPDFYKDMIRRHPRGFVKPLDRD